MQSCDVISKNIFCKFGWTLHQDTIRRSHNWKYLWKYSSVNLVLITRRDRWQNISLSWSSEKFGILEKGVNLTSLFTNRFKKFLHGFFGKYLLIIFSHKMQSCQSAPPGSYGHKASPLNFSTPSNDKICLPPSPQPWKTLTRIPEL